MRSIPGCGYIDWSRRINEGHAPKVYAHVATDPDYPGQIALQYWMFYVFNDWNNLHEGDWEMIQLNFHAATAAQALETTPYEVGYSQHEGAEGSSWTDPKLETGGRHPPGRVPGRRLARELLLVGALPRRLRVAGRRL